MGGAKSAQKSFELCETFLQRERSYVSYEHCGVAAGQIRLMKPADSQPPNPTVRSIEK